MTQRWRPNKESQRNRIEKEDGYELRQGSFDLPACPAAVESDSGTVIVSERSAPVISAFGSCPLEHLALIYSPVCLTSLQEASRRGGQRLSLLYNYETLMYCSFFYFSLPLLFLLYIFCDATVPPPCCISCLFYLYIFLWQFKPR